MTVPTWPSELPLPDQEGWNRQPQDSRRARGSEAGPVTFDRQFSSAAQFVSLSLALDRDQNAIFDKFFKQTTAKGSLPFWMADPTTDGWPIYLSSGAQMLISGGPNHGKPILLAAMWLCSFGRKLPEETIRGVTFTRSFELVVYP